MEELVIDGCNLAYKAFGGAGDGEREALTQALAARYCAKKVLVTLVWDSKAGEGMQQLLPNLKVRYAPSADDHILRLVRESTRPRSITVVTDDRPVADSARSLGAKLIRSSDFTALCPGLRGRKHAPAPTAEVKPSYETEEEKRRLLDLWQGHTP